MSTPWLARYTADPASLRLWQSMVHTVRGHSVVTDAYGILAVRDGGVQEWPPAVEDDRTHAEGERLLRPYLDLRPDRQLTTTLDDLAGWCELVQWCACDACGGESPGRDYCENCDSEGRWLPSPYHLRPGLLAGIPIDRNRLGWMLAPELWDLGDRTVSVGVAMGKVVILDGVRWRLVLVGVNADRYLTEAERARFDADPLFRYLWLDREDEAGACALADWRMERES